MDKVDLCFPLFVTKISFITIMKITILPIIITNEGMHKWTKCICAFLCFFTFFQHTISIFLEFQCSTNSECQLLYYITSLTLKIAEIESSFLFLSLRRASLSGNETWASETIWHQFHPILSQNIMTWGWGLSLWWLWRLWWWWLLWLLW